MLYYKQSSKEEKPKRKETRCVYLYTNQRTNRYHKRSLKGLRLLTLMASVSLNLTTAIQSEQLITA